MPVKSIEVPEVEATAVPEISGYRLVVSPLDNTCPEDSKSGVVIPAVPSKTIGIFFSDQRTTQREPLEIVTVTPESTVIGPVLMAFFVPGMV
jgi:hypothetical protein